MRDRERIIHSVEIQSASMLSFLPAAVLDSIGISRDRRMQFVRASGEVFERWVGMAILTVVGLGWRTLGGLNLRVDEQLGQLVDRGPVPAAAA